MKKLLLTSALIGSTLVASSAFAQTTVTGNLDIAYKFLAEKGTLSAGGHSVNGFGKEAQINIQNKGKLSNGWDYAAGFAIEDDGNQAGSYFNENTYIDLIMGSTTITIGQDHIQNSDRTLGNFLGLVAEDLSNTTGGGRKSDKFISSMGSNPAASYGIGVVQQVGNYGSFSALFVPNNNAAVVSTDIAADDAAADVGKSAWEIGFVGSLGVAGLNTHAFYNEEKATTGSPAVKALKSDQVGYNIGVSYTMGQTSLGYNYKYNDTGLTATVSSATAVTGVENGVNGTQKQHEYAIAYAVNPQLTLGAQYTKVSTNFAADSDPTSKSIAIGYNLGAVALTAQAAQLRNYSGVAGEDSDVLYLRASTKF
jgi:hypothetical protein